MYVQWNPISVLFSRVFFFFWLVGWVGGWVGGRGGGRSPNSFTAAMTATRRLIGLNSTKKSTFRESNVLCFLRNLSGCTNSSLTRLHHLMQLWTCWKRISKGFFFIIAFIYIFFFKIKDWKSPVCSHPVLSVRVSDGRRNVIGLNAYQLNSRLRRSFRFFLIFFSVFFCLFGGHSFFSFR